MSENAFLAQDVDLDVLAERTKNFSGAEIEGLVKDAAAYALNRNINFDDLQAPLDEDNIKVGMFRGKEAGARDRGQVVGTCIKCAIAGALLGCLAHVQVTMHDFEKALEEVKPAFGASTDMLNSYCTHGMLPCGETFDHLRETLRALVQQVG